MGVRGVAVAAGALMALWSLSARAQAPLQLAHTQPGHIDPPTLWPMDPPPRHDYIGFEQLSAVVLRSSQTLAKQARLEPKLSELCRYNMFHQLRDGWLNAVFADVTLGAAYGSGRGLYDPGAAADPARLYLFRQAQSSACDVRSIPAPEAVAARAGG
jgi:hypothetical protein